jgi:hypothetical protein
MTDQRDPNTVAVDAGTPTPQPAADVATGATPQPAVSTPQPSDTSNAPDAMTPAAKSIPQNLVNNPAAPTQKMATQADLNKNSVAPTHSWMYKAAQALSGGPQYTTRYDNNGNAVRTEKPVPASMLWASIALHALTAGAEGMAAHGPGRYGQSAEIGVEAGAKQREQQQSAQAQQDAQAKQDQSIKMNTIKTNLTMRQLAQNVGKQDLETNQAYVKSLEPQVEMIEKHPELIKGDVPEDKIDLKKFPATSYLYIPHGEPFPIMDTATGKQKEVNGVPTWGHNYYIVDAKAKGTLTKEIQDQGYKIGKFRNPDGSRVNVPEDSEYPMSTIAQYGKTFAQIQTAEELLDQHKNDILGEQAGPRESLADWAAQEPRNMQAVEDFGRFAGAGAPDQIYGAMMANGAGQSAQLLMQHMGVTNEDVTKAENKRLEEHTAATTKASQAPEVERQKKLDEVLKDPITAANADSVIAAHNKPTEGIVIPEDRYNQAIAFNAQKAEQAGIEESKKSEARTKAESEVGDIPTLAKNIVAGDFSNVGDVTSYRGGQRIALTNALHDAAVAAGKNPNDYSAGALKAKTAMYQDYHNNKNGTGANITAFDAFLGHANDALDANADWKRTKSPLLNQPLNWIATNATNDPNYVKFTTALEPVRKEFMSFLNANRAEHEADIKTMSTVLDDNKTPLQIETALKQLGNSADIRLAAMARTYQRTMGRPFEGLITPQGQAALTKMNIVPSSYSKVSIPGQKPFYVSPDKSDAVKAKYPNAVITER